jgi:hypothetical protein
MKNLKTILLFIIPIIACSCNNSPAPYLYETNPHYTWGQAIFYGADYADYGYCENILSLSLFTEQLDTINNGTQLAGIGQYLYIDEIFLEPADSLMPEGIYTISSEIGKKAITPGGIFEVDGTKYSIGARIYYLEPNEDKNIILYITEGTMAVTKNKNSAYNITFDFRTKDGKALNGFAENIELPHYDDSVITKNSDKKSVSHYLGEKRLKRTLKKSGAML